MEVKMHSGFKPGAVRVLILLFVMTMTVGATPPVTAAQAGAPLTIVATHTIIGDIVGNVGRDHIKLVTLVGPNGEPHYYEPTPADLRVLGQAAIVFETGFGFETWMGRAHTASGGTASRVPVSANITPIIALDGPEAGEPDPHFWFDARHMMSAVEVVRDSLSHVDPANADAYRANAATYLGQLRELDDWIVQQVGTVPSTQRTIVTSHDTFGYFARRYGFQVAGTALTSFSSEAQPSAQHVNALVREIRSAQVRVIFPENVANTALMERIAREAGVSLGQPLYTDALGDPSGPAGTYIGMMRSNVSAIMDSLRR
jgi:ABC-type Zn uptake system ZnuABC Zn-binding protein ZnuA